MKHFRMLLLSSIAGLYLLTEVAQAADESVFLGTILPPAEQTMGQGQSARWALPHAAIQYQPIAPTPAMQAALQAQHEGRFLDALILLDQASKTMQAGMNSKAEISLLRASFLLQGNQTQQAIEILTPVLTQPQYAVDALALTAMAHLQQGHQQKALAEAQRAQAVGSGILPHLIHSYALQGAGRLLEARAVMHDFNARTPQLAVALAREAELALTLNQIQPAKTLMLQAQQVDATHPYIIAVSGLIYLIDGQTQQAKAAFQTTLQHDPMDAKALLGLGLAEIKLGNFQAGQKYLLAANEADPGNALILTYLGRLQQHIGQTEQAKKTWRSAQQADPKDPTPWLYQAQAELQANQPHSARESLRQAQARAAYRSVYRGERLLDEDQLLLQANLAEIQRRLGLDSLALHTLSAPVGEKNSANLKNQADILQMQRFGESARRSLILQSQFNDKPGNLPAALDIYGDGAGQTGSSTPQHGVVSGLGAQHTSYNNYDELFSPRTTLATEAFIGNRNSSGEQIRLGAGNDTLGLGIAQRQFKTDGYTRFDNLESSTWQGIVQWQPVQSTLAFVSYHTFDAKHGETFYPADPLIGVHTEIDDDSQVTRLGLRHTLSADGNNELRALWSRQQTDQITNYEDFSDPPFIFTSTGNSSARSEELQYRRSGATYATQWGLRIHQGQTLFLNSDGSLITADLRKSQTLYAASQHVLNPYWQLNVELSWGDTDTQSKYNAANSTRLKRWLPKLGLVYTPDTETHIRLAAWRGMGIPGIGDATLAPASLAGVVLTRPGDDGRLVQAVALGGDRQLNSDWLLAAQAQRRKASEPVVLGQQILLVSQVNESKMALHWQPATSPWTVSLTHEYEKILNDPILNALNSVDTQNLRSQKLAARWFANAQWTLDLAWSHNQIAGTQKSRDPSFIPILVTYQDRFNQVDANLNWQFNRSGLFTTGVRNATDTRFQYSDPDRLNPRFGDGRLFYAKLHYLW